MQQRTKEQTENTMRAVRQQYEHKKLGMTWSLGCQACCAVHSHKQAHAGSILWPGAVAGLPTVTLDVKSSSIVYLLLLMHPAS
jgi:hypothetical protein